MKKVTSRDRLLDATFEEIYRYGYHGASTAAILKKAGVPKGSMYHHFASKKEMVLAMIHERLIPKVREFFDFQMKPGVSASDILDYTLQKISKNRMLIQHGCPLHRLMFEMEGVDDEISDACAKEFDNLCQNLAKVVRYGMKEGYFRKDDPNAVAGYIIAASWGFLSRPAALSSPGRFLEDMERLLKSIRS